MPVRSNAHSAWAWNTSTSIRKPILTSVLTNRRSAAIWKKKGVELIVLAGYMRFIGEELLTHYPRRIINIHPAYLPNFPGAHGIRDAYEAKVPFTGVTVHYVDEGIDTGEIILQEKLSIDPAWTLEELETHVHALEYELFPRAVRQICKEIEEGKQ